jgi:hypothetical protein
MGKGGVFAHVYPPVRGLYIEKYPPPGGGYQPMSFGENIKRVREKRGKCKRKRKKWERKWKKGKEKEKMGSKR